MKISEYIQALTELKDQYGDLDVETKNIRGRVTAPTPEIGYTYLHIYKRRKPEFYDEHIHDPIFKGWEVCRI